MRTSPDSRRQSIVEELQGHSSPISAQALAARLGVSRQIIVSDVAILRERGFAIDSTPRGYLLNAPLTTGLEETLTCRHAASAMASELYAIVDAGGVALDIRIDHPVYGCISMPLNIASRLDVDRFLSDMNTRDGLPLSLLTDGVHTHRIRAQSADALKHIRLCLQSAGILLVE